jgi:hypothetical protein
LQEEPKRVVGDAILRVIEVETHRLGGQARCLQSWWCSFLWC